MIAGMCIQIVVDVALVFACYFLEKRGRNPDSEAVPVSRAAAACCAAVLVHVLGSLPLAASVDFTETTGRATYFFVTVGSGLVPAILFALMFIKAASTSSARALYGLTTAQPVKTDFSKARALVHQDDIDGAVQEFRRQFRESPDDSDGLFKAARLLREEKRYKEAADTFRDILRHFKNHDTVWSRAAFELGELYDGPLEDKQAATYIFQEIFKRAPQSVPGSMAQARLRKGDAYVHRRNYPVERITIRNRRS